MVPGIPARHALRDGARHFRIAHRDIVERAVRLDVDDGAAEPAHHLVQARDLGVHRVRDRLRRHGDFQPSEILAVGIARVRADAYAALQREARGALHGLRVAGMPAAGDIGRGDVGHQRRLVRRVIQFAHVAVQVDLHSEYNHSS